MAEGIVSMVIEALEGILVGEVKFLSGVGDQIEHAQMELRLMQGFLNNLGAKQGDNEVVRIWVQIRDATYDLENVIESFALKVALRKEESVKLVLKSFACILNEVALKRGGSVKLARFASILNEGVNLQKIGKKIESITANLSELRSSLQRYNIKHITGTQYGGARQTYPHVIDRDVVGLERDIEILVSQLVREEKGPQVVSIWGMGGSGKTTLAKQVYNHNEDVRRHFDCFAWVCVSQQCQGKEVLVDILIKLTQTTKGEEREEISKMKKDQIAERLCLIQKEKKCLVVLDDIWTRDAWNSLKPGFPVGEETKSRILLTTRKKDVAEIARENGFIHESRALDDNESWELFKTIAISGRDQTNTEIYAEKEELGKKMLKHCAGLPLAITVLAGLLARKVGVEEWKTVNKNVDVYIPRGTNLDQEYKGDQEYAGVLRLLASSYDDLPYRLKLCFLYLGHFSKGYEISVKTLTRLWIAEGFIPLVFQGHGSAEVLEDVAYNCLCELVQRSMVKVGRLGSTKTIKTCYLHDHMRDLCLVKAKEENFLHVVKFTDTITKATTLTKVRVLAVHVEKKCVDRFAFARSDHLRSLLFSVDPECNYSNWKEKFLRSVVFNFKLLRVLKFEGIMGEVELPSNFGNLVYLRFLSLKGSCVIRLPSSLGNLVCLQTLDLCLAYFGPTVEVPNVIWKMKELRHLYLPRWGYKGKLKLATLGNLQSLVNVKGADCDLTHLAELTNLRKLFISDREENMEEMLKSNGITFNHLRSLSLDSGVIPMNMVLSCPHIYKLQLEGRIRDQSLEGLQYYRNLTKMSLKYTGIQLESLKILEKIPNLRMLWFGRDSIDENVTEVVVSEEGYPNLEFLSLESLWEIKSWSIEKGGMPSLCRLSIEWGTGLRGVPEGLENVTTLKELTINGMPREFCRRVGEGGEDFYKIKHVPSLLITNILQN